MMRDMMKSHGKKEAAEATVAEQYRLETIGEMRGGAWEVEKARREALKGLAAFSHAAIFYVRPEGGTLGMQMVRLAEVKEQEGRIVSAEGVFPEGAALVDVKPYFPCEDRVRPDELQRPTQRLPRERTLPLTAEGQLIRAGKIRKDAGTCHIVGMGSEALAALEGFSHVRVVWWFDRFDRPKYRRATLCQPPYERAARTGIFSTRSPVRPNPLAMTTARIHALNVQKGLLEISGLDAFDGTPVVGVWPMGAEGDEVSDVRVPQHLAHWPAYFSEPIEVQNELPPFEEEETAEGNGVGDFPQSEKTLRAWWADVAEAGDAETTSMRPEIRVEGARQNNLKNVTLAIPKHQMTVVVGVSGSGKSSLVFDTVYAESRRRFADCMEDSDRAHLPRRPEVDRITGLPPAVAVGQENAARNPRSTVGTLTEVHDALRRLYAVAGVRHCPSCGQIIPHAVGAVCARCDRLFFELTPAQFSFNNPEAMCTDCKGLGVTWHVDEALIVTSPERSLLDGASPWWGDLRRYAQKPNANWMKGEVLALAAEAGVDLETPWRDLPETFCREVMHGSGERAVRLAYSTDGGRRGEIVRPAEGAIPTIERLLREGNADATDGWFSEFLRETPCSSCHGERLSPEGRCVTVAGRRFPEIAALPLVAMLEWVHSLPAQLPGDLLPTVESLLRPLRARLQNLCDAGVGYLSADRAVPGLSGGEIRRLRLAARLGGGMSDLLYVLDEPTAGLHPQDAHRIIRTLRRLRDEGHTLLIVEHDEAVMRAADQLVEIGPGAGVHGGRLVVAGTPAEVMQCANSATGRALAVRTPSARVSLRTSPRLPRGYLTLHGAHLNNLKNLTVPFPLGVFCCVTGVSGSGKSTLVRQTLLPLLRGERIEGTTLSGAEEAGDLVCVTQQPIGRTSKSNPATYTGLFEPIRELLATLPAARAHGWTASRFSFNSPSGRCPACRGEGSQRLALRFMEDIRTECPLCHGRRYNPETLALTLNGKNIADILDMTVEEALAFFEDDSILGSAPAVAQHTEILRILHTLCDVGLGYIHLGQSATTLSGGEAQRVKLARELHRPSADGHTLYLLDEPTAGLHFSDISALLALLQRLTERGNSLIVIEHHPDVIRAADWILDLGPGAGDAGGRLIASGPPSVVANVAESATAALLR